ncbi:MAG: hypothetical protein M3Q47_16760 [Actinomycetota bacterium]|nr:hypothetical protein [Actinomycetota bacterium]
MSAWLLRAPWWAMGLASAVPLGVVFVLMGRFVRDESWLEALVWGGVIGLLCGGVVGAIATSRLREDAGGMPPEAYARIERATRRGPSPWTPRSGPRPTTCWSPVCSPSGRTGRRAPPCSPPSPPSRPSARSPGRRGGG